MAPVILLARRFLTQGMIIGGLGQRGGSNRFEAEVFADDGEDVLPAARGVEVIIEAQARTLVALAAG